MPTLQQLRYLVAIAETLHFRRAAEMTHVTQPTLSGQLRELEAKLGVQLVERSRARVVLTPIGKTIATRARTILHNVQDIVELAKHGQTMFAGTIRVGVLQSLGPYLLPLILPELHETYPSLKIYVREGMPAELSRGLDEGNLELLFSPLPMRGADLDSTTLFREPLWVGVAAEHELAVKDHVAKSDLEGQTVLTLEPGHRLHEQVRDLCREFGADLSHDYEGTSLDTLRQMVGLGMGLSFLPALYVRSEVAKDRQVVPLPLQPTPPYRVIGMVWRRHSARRDEYLALAEHIRTILKRDVAEVTVMQ